MSAGMLWDNVVAYSLQVGLLVAVAAFLPAVLRLRMPRPRLFFWHLLLTACVLLPLVRPPQPSVATGKIEITTGAFTPIAPARPASPIHLTRAQAALLLLAAGMLGRLCWLGIGMWRLSRYRLRSTPLAAANPWSVEADLRISDEISSPVTFGFRHPVVLLPPRFPSLDAAKQEAILCHEILHVRRRDWLFTLAEELLRSVFWFHPAIWWLLGEIQLTREQAVDREVIELTKSSDDYVDALLTMAGAHPRLDLAPAPLFLRKRHLKQRVVSILKEVRMSKKNWITALTAATVILAATCWFVTGAFPLAAEPQLVADAPGVSVELNGSQLVHRTHVQYPREAMEKHIQGTVVLQVKLNGSGEVTDATVLSGPDELRKAAMQSVLDWHFTRDAANGTRQVSFTFELPKNAAVEANGNVGVSQSVTVSPATINGVVGGVPAGVSGGVRGGVLGGVIGSVPSGMSPATETTLRRITINGLGDQARTELLARLPVREGEQISRDSLSKIMQAVHEYDPHLSVGVARVSPTESDLQIHPPDFTFQPFANAPPPAGTARIQVGGNQQQDNLISQMPPAYPPLAKQARISGTVTLAAVIATDGHIKNLSVVKGHPLLVQAALDAVKDWVYRPTLLNGQAVEVATTIDINFTLSQ